MKRLLVLTLTFATAISLFSVAAPTASAANIKPKHHHSIFGWLHSHLKATDPAKIQWHSF